MTSSTVEPQGDREGGKAPGVTAVALGPGWSRETWMVAFLGSFAKCAGGMTLTILGLVLFRHLLPPSDVHCAIRVMLAVPLMTVWFLPLTYRSQALNGKRPWDPYRLGLALGLGISGQLELRFLCWILRVQI